MPHHGPVSSPETRSESPASPVLVVLAAGGLCLLLITLLGFVVVRFGGAGGSAAAETIVVEPAPTNAAQPSPTRKQSGSRSGGRLQVDAAWVDRTAARAGIPAPALRAYATVQLRLAEEQPGCHLGWNTLAGIGWVESHHGTIGDRTLNADGTSSTTILGPALDGGEFAAIRSTPRSRAWHGDRTWEHAVGPLQFIGSTWERWGADGDGNGVADPRDLDDAALTAGRYLCADAHDLATDSGWTRAVHSYNHDTTYVSNVAAAANAYAQRAR